MRRLINRKQAGAAAIEFALLLLPLLMLFYGLSVYIVFFIMKQHMTFAAEEGARAAMRYVASPNTREQIAKQVATEAVAVLPPGQKNAIAIDAISDKNSSTCTYIAPCTITVSVSVANPKSVLPSLLGLPFPGKFESKASVLIDQ
ncbi:hypothetical protein JHS3_28480 [Jeongeupia sp. HS-3]|uniref:TadE/TadG family type IV pilus assembly protein n=1 Tax=Jeongeupia sp. HS-3 TaxID=1009682 RepID=UPI0018A42961|nr:TadE/TadG family type IV pilus assembly protein [Jeongeupia sp. HS-3]BCL77112.1 hypothetical protein JHS3_28480 [Jeongeupia sp. HS-3]